MPKALGADITEFYLNNWPSGYYIDDCDVDITNHQNEPVLDPDKTYDLSSFGVLVQEDSGESYPFAKFFQKWKKSRDVETLIVSVPKDQAGALRDEMKARGYKTL